MPKSQGRHVNRIDLAILIATILRSADQPVSASRTVEWRSSRLAGHPASNLRRSVPSRPWVDRECSSVCDFNCLACDPFEAPLCGEDYLAWEIYLALAE